MAGSEGSNLIAVERARGNFGGTARTSNLRAVQLGDSLSHIASQLNLTGMTIDQVLVYLFRANPHAFANDNMNHLLAGKTLKIPPVNPETLPTAFEASQLVDEHYGLWIQREVTP